MQHTYLIQPCTGQGIDVAANQTLAIIDVEGKQVVDFLQNQKIPQ